jgi:hypothetical protein
LSSFWFIIKQQWTIEEISIFSNSSHLEWRVELSDTILKWDYPRTIPARFGLTWFCGFRGKDLNVIFYQNMPNLHNLYKSGVIGRWSWFYLHIYAVKYVYFWILQYTAVGTTLRCRRNSCWFKAGVPEKKFTNRTMHGW